MGGREFVWYNLCNVIFTMAFYVVDSYFVIMKEKKRHASCLLVVLLRLCVIQGQFKAV